MTQSISDLYYGITNRRFLYNIMPIRNIPSVIEHGIVCFDMMRNFPHASVAQSEVQKRRDQVYIPGGQRLHSYANLYFAYDNPMLYKRKDQAEELCILVISSKVMNIEGCIVSDQNAATDLVRFFPPETGLGLIDFDLVFAQFWTHSDDYYKQIHHKRVKCAEVLIPERVPYKYVVGAYVLNEQSYDIMVDYGFSRKIVINSGVFYR